MWHVISKSGDQNAAAPLLIKGLRIRCHFLGTPVEEGELTGKIDTGASMTVIPLDLARSMKLPSKGSTENLRAFDSSIPSRIYPKYLAELFIPTLGWRILEVMACDRKDVLIGRDIFNKMLLLANWHSSGFGIRPAKPIHGMLRLFFSSLWESSRVGRFQEITFTLEGKAASNSLAARSYSAPNHAVLPIYKRLQTSP